MSKKPHATKYINLDVIGDLGSKSARRRFMGTFIGIAALTAFAFCMPDFQIRERAPELWRTTAGNLFSTSILIILVYGAYILFIHEDTERPEIETLRPQDINGQIRYLPTETSSYYLWGRSASYFRAETIRALSDSALTNRRNIDITVLLPDPEIPKLAEAYEDIIRELREEVEEDKLFKNAVATAAACALTAANNRYVSIKVCFSQFLPSFRIDLSDQGAILTEDKKELYGLKFSSRSQFFEMFKTMINYEVKISRSVDLNKYAWRNHVIGEDKLPLEALLSFGFSSEKVEKHKNAILELISNPDHRYK